MKLDDWAALVFIVAALIAGAISLLVIFGIWRVA